MDVTQLLPMLRADLQRMGPARAEENEYLTHLLQAARASLDRQGVRDDDSADYAQAVVSTAAWLYRKRISGEAEPAFLRRMRLDLIVSQQVRGAAAT